MKYLLALVLTLGVVAGGGYWLNELNTKRGKYVQVVNETDVDLVCFIGEYDDINVPAYSTSIFYPAPRNKNNWGCWDDNEED